MLTVPVGNAVKVTLPFIDYEGNPVTPTGLLLSVFDEEGDQIAGPIAPAFDPGDTELEYTIAQGLNLVPGVRVVELKVTDATGAVHLVTETVALIETKKLVVPVNSFQTYEMALLTAANMPPLEGWAAADDTLRRNALEEAYLRLTRYGYSLRQQCADIQPWRWQEMTRQEFNDLPAHFRTALCKAQVFEASEVLRIDIFGDKRRSGILSESIGESSMMFRTGKPMELGVSRQALDYLTGYINMRITITRT